MKLLPILLSGLCALSSLVAEILPVSIPSPVELHYTGFVQTFRDLPDHASRVEFLKKEKAKEKSGYFHPENPSWAVDVFRHFQGRVLTFSWNCTEGEIGPFQVELSESPDFQDALLYVSYKDWSKGTWYPFYHLEAYHNTLKIGTKYYWRVRSLDLKNPDTPSPWSATETFTTQDLPPRQIWLEHIYPASNIRDIGGWKTEDGRRIRQGLAFRSGAFNDTSSDTHHPGRIRIGVADQETLTDVLKIRTEIDLRTRAEVGDTDHSPIGPSVRFILSPVPAYAGAFTEEGMAKYRAVFKHLANPENYPLVFHCVGGADRTATLAIFLNGLLGVTRHDLECDWECTFLPDLPCLEKNCQSRCCSLVFQGLEKFGTPEDSLPRKIELYLQECGVTPEEIQRIREILLEP